MRLLVTAGNTQAPIDAVRCITNIFTGRTGAAIAVRAAERGHDAHLLTPHPETVPHHCAGLGIETYRTFGELRQLMASRIRGGGHDAVVHCAAVSDYLVRGIHARPDGPALDPAGKLKSDVSELWLRLERAPKLIDAVRGEWGFRGTLVKFKLEVGVSDNQLTEIAERSRQQSGADLMVANTLEGLKEWAFFGPFEGKYVRVARSELADRLLDAVEMP